MCGIAGFYPCCEKSRAVGILKRMLTRIKHRGPDQSGILLSKDVGLGSVRLSIIDLETGAMPLSNEDETLWIVFNGEVYNYLELKKELEVRNHIFKTTSDTEVVLHLYQEYGPQFLNKLNGQFAIAIWDSRKKELLLARDRVGIRPLFYTKVNSGVVFASEMKALFEYPGVNASISPISLSQVFTFWTSLSPRTIFQDIYEVRPGHYMRVNSERIEEEKYWELPLCRPDEYKNFNIEEAIGEFRELFSDAIRIRLRADVPVGAYLSGGIDSSVTTAFIREHSPDKLRTFSIGFADKEFDETIYQKQAAEYFETNHTSIKCHSNDIARNFTDVVWHCETPILRSAPAPMCLLSGLVKKHNIKVVITGEGADELLGGYNIFKEAMIRQFWAKDPQSKYRPLLLRKLYPYIPQMNGAKALNLFFSYKLSETHSPVYSHLIRWMNTSRIKSYFSNDIKALIRGYDPVGELEDQLTTKFQGVDLLSRAQWLEINLFMSGYLLSSQGDRMAMANSVEGRYPFLDHRIIDFCMKIPPKYKLNILNEKYLLKRMMQDKLPDKINKRSKQAYRAPIVPSISSDYFSDMLSERQIKSSGLFNPDIVNRLVARMNSNIRFTETDRMALMGILSTQILNYLFVQRHMKKLTPEILVDCKVIIMN